MPAMASCACGSKGAGSDCVPVQIADQVLAPGWTELASGYPSERMFEGWPRR